MATLPSGSTHQQLFYRLCDNHTSMIATAFLYALDCGDRTMADMAEIAARYERHADACENCEPEPIQAGDFDGVAVSPFDLGLPDAE